MARPEILERLKVLRETAISILLGEHRVPYPPEQFQHLVVDVADVLARTGSNIVQAHSHLTGSNASLSPQDEDLLREVVEDLKREGVMIDGLNSSNPRWPFFRLSSRAEDILQSKANSPRVGDTQSGNSEKSEITAVSEQAHTVNAPKAFISYSWDDEPHKLWVREFAVRLRADGVDATLDQWSLAPGDRLPHFMEQSVRENSYVIIICTENYKNKSDNRTGGVGYEGDIMTAEVYAKGNHRKFIPVLRCGNWNTALPSWLSGKYSIDLRANPFSDVQYQDLVATLHNLRDQAPPIGTLRITTRNEKPKSGTFPTPTEVSEAFVNQSYKRYLHYRQTHTQLIPEIGIREIGAVIVGEFVQPELDQAYMWRLFGVQRFSGWRPFLSLVNCNSGIAEVVYDEEGVESFNYVTEMFHFLDFNRIEHTGKFYYLEGFRDDLSKRIEPREQLEFVMETARVAEVIATILLFAKEFCGDNSANQLSFMFRWRGVAKRHLTSWASSGRNFCSPQMSARDEVVTRLMIPVSITIEELGPYVEAIVKPLFRCFGGWTFDKTVIQQIVTETIQQNL